MSLRRLKEEFCTLILSLIQIPKTIFCFIFGRFLQVKDAEELQTSLTDDDDLISDDDEDMNKTTKPTISTTDTSKKDVENPQEKISPNADESVGVDTMRKSNDVVLNVKSIDEIKEENTKEVTTHQDGSKDDLSQEKGESANFEMPNDQFPAVIKEHVYEDLKREPSIQQKSRKTTSSVNVDLEQEHCGDTESPESPKTASCVYIGEQQEHSGDCELPKALKNTSPQETTQRSKRKIPDEPNKNPKIPKPRQTTSRNRYGEGIENHSNSCYLDSTLFSLLYKEDVFDGRLLQGEDAKDSRNETSEEVTRHLNKIADLLRKKNYCPASYVTELRRSMCHINDRIVSSMMDVDELLANLLGKALQLNNFIIYCTKQGVTTGNFYHQILINPNLQRATYGNVQDLLEESMKMQHLTFKEPPTPALIIKMPRSSGRLVGHKQIIPNLILDISKQLQDSSVCTNHLYELRAVITLYAKHYTAYVRRNSTGDGESIARWEYFNDLPPSIREIDSLDSILSNINNRENNPDFGIVTRDIHVCIYNPCSS